MLRWNKFLPILLGFNFIFAQSISIIDTVMVQKDQQIIILNPFIVDSSLYIFHEGRLIEDYQLNTVLGELKLSEPALKEGIFNISYKYIQQELPIKVGPIYKELPNIDSLLANDKFAEIKNELLPDIINKDNSNLATTGTIYRNISISPLGGSDFSGGLQLQLQGELSNDIIVSGVLSDQSIPIQPEGTTQTLDEIDKVYLHVEHPIFQIMAGDIEYSLNTGKYLNVNRKLEGLRGELAVDKWFAQGTLASSQGRYNKLSFKGTDGSQGPYALISETGNRDIVVLAGTEKVYVNGEQVKRGENFDYTIDYSVGEVTFTPRQLIDNDTDIYIEYEYSNYQYTRNLISSSVERNLDSWGNIGFSWLKEKDQMQIDESSASGILDSLKIAGDNNVKISRAKITEDGKYLLIDGKYIYSPNSIDDIKYDVSFQNDNENGNYLRRISNSGEIYFEFIDIGSRTDDIDLYSPFSTWNKPVNHEIFQIFGKICPSNKTQANWDVSLSNLDKNIYSALDDDDNLGLAYNLDLNGSGINLFNDVKLGYRIINWNRSNSFNEISKERDPLFNREWNIVDVNTGKESLLSSEINLNITEKLNSSAQWSKYKSFLNVKDRITASISSSTKYLPQLNSYINKVSSDKSNFYQYKLNAEFFPGNFHPIINYNGEFQERSHNFDVTKIGFLYSKNKNYILASISQRIDQESLENDSTKMSLSQKSIYAEIEINSKINNNLTSKIVLKKRISDNYKTNGKLNYLIGTANLRYINKSSPIRWELLSKLEETYAESRAVVYDSVGTGLGSYRYDEEFNDYIADPNGNYISYTVLTGERELTTHLSGSQRFYIDFSKTKIELLKNIDFRSDIKSDFRGELIDLEKVFSPNINDEQITISKYNIRSEINYNDSGRRIRNWMINILNLNGTDPRGNDLQKQTEYGVEWSEVIKNEMNSLFNVDYHIYDNSSTFSQLRDRQFEGWWLAEQIKWNIERKWQFSVTVLGGSDEGVHNERPFNAYSYGLNFEGQHFIKASTSLKIKAELHNSISKTSNSAIPPEALNGLPIGKSFSLNLQSQILLGNNLSLNTAVSYIDNSRYDNFLSFSGELRAYF